jgi:7-carboxy-7-deazaguanine synthase
MSKVKVAEIFYSLQGEGKWAGVPSVFLRSFGCNFECRGFGMPAGEHTDNPEQIAKDVDKFDKYEDLPLTEFGCDSYASWHKDFKKFSPVMETSDIVNKMQSLIPNNQWSSNRPYFADKQTEDVHLVITGGEPLLGWQRAWPGIIGLCKLKGLQNVTFETNGTQELSNDFCQYLNEFTEFGKHYDRLTFSVSAKLPCSGEKWEDAIKPDVVKHYQEHGFTYLKFVVATKDDVNDVDRAVTEYRNAGVDCPVYLMPVGGVPNQYHLNVKEVAALAMTKGYRYSPRLQVDIWKNAWGT